MIVNPESTLVLRDNGQPVADTLETFMDCPKASAEVSRIASRVAGLIFSLFLPSMTGIIRRHFMRRTVRSKTVVRKIAEMKLREVSLVTFPMNERAQVLGVKTLGEDVSEQLREFRETLAACRKGFGS